MNMKSRLRSPVLWTLFIGFAITPTLEAQAPAPAAPQQSYELQTRREWTLLAAGGAMWGLSHLAHPEHRCPCSSMGINGLDRRFAGEPIRKGADTASNVLIGVTATAPFLIGYLDRRGKPSGSTEFKADAFILGETLLINEGLNSLVKNLVGRPRPFAYGLTAGDPALTQNATYTSFYSAHTSS